MQISLYRVSGKSLPDFEVVHIIPQYLISNLSMQRSVIRLTQTRIPLSFILKRVGWHIFCLVGPVTRIIDFQKIVIFQKFAYGGIQICEFCATKLVFFT